MTQEQFLESLRGKRVMVKLLVQGDGNKASELGRLTDWDAHNLFLNHDDRVTMVPMNAIASVSESPNQQGSRTAVA